MNHDGASIFLLEAIELVATYLFGRSVELSVGAVGLTPEIDQSDDTIQFLHELEARHAIACALRLRDVLPQVERGLSTTAVLFRAESKGAIRGRLDIPHYIARRYQQLSLPRRYPILTNRQSPETPENALAVKVLSGLAAQLGKSGFPSTTAEGRASIALYGWTRTRLKRWPWSEVTSLAPLPRLRNEAQHRIRKRQTGNESAYSSLLDWIAEWQVDLSQLTSPAVERMVGGLLAFPTGDFFWEKVFEIWCLREVARSLERCGCDLVEGPRPLHKRGEGAIYRFQHESAEVSVWFQRQLPLGSPRWKYEAGSAPFTGVPDVVVVAEGRVPLIVDAKFRTTTQGQSRAEETYKMLGYAENFRDSLGAMGLQGVLVFVGDSNTAAALVSPDNGRLVQIIVDNALRSRAAAEHCFDEAIRGWLQL